MQVVDCRNVHFSLPVAMKIDAATLRGANQMIEIRTRSWRHFEGKLEELLSAYSQLERQKSGGYLPHLLFRGQSNSRYALTTTLDRYPVKVKTFAEYYLTAYGARHEIEASSGQRWDIPEPLKVDVRFTNAKAFTMEELPAYDYLVYLRHHGFPSPLLDWSRSPYVAAFFALSNAQANQRDPIAIYAFLESTGAGKVGSLEAPRIVTLGPYVRTHRRHYLQQAEYTICAQYVAHDWAFALHESAMGREHGEDVLIKFTIPARDRVTALQQLDRFNLNAFSIYGSEDALMQTMALREFEFSDRIRRRELYEEHLRRKAEAE